MALLPLHCLQQKIWRRRQERLEVNDSFCAVVEEAWR
jgi:hypothetical protein